MTSTIDRPETLNEMIGQAETIARLRIAVGGAITRGTRVPHILLSGPAGTGKTTLARIVASETGGSMVGKGLHAQTLAKKGDLASILCSAEDGDVVFIDEIHALTTGVSECLLEALEDGTLSVVVGKGPTAHAMKVDLPAVTIVGATSKPGALSTPLRDRFGLHLTMQPYTDSELSRIAAKVWQRAEVDYTDRAAEVVGSRSKGVPRLAIHLAERVLDCAAIMGEPVDDYLAEKAMRAFGIGAGGIDEIDHRILVCLVETFGGAPVGLDALGAALDLDPKTLQNEHEPALTRAGLLMRTAGGRVCHAEGSRTGQGCGSVTVNPLTVSLTPKMAPLLAEVGKLPAHERAYAAGRLVAESLVVQQAFREMRRQAMREMRANGLTWQQIGDMLGITKQKAIVYAEKQSPMRDRKPTARAAASEA